jgi:hypothetical protein
MPAIFKQTGLIRVATIANVSADRLTADVYFTNSKDLYRIQLPLVYASSDGAFIGGVVSKGTQVAVCQAEGSQHYFVVSFLARDPSNSSLIRTTKNLPLIDGQLVIQQHPNSKISLTKHKITIGDSYSYLNFDTDNRILTTSFSNQIISSEGHKEIIGTILRDRNTQTSSKEIGLDPIATTINSSYGEVPRNPARVERREVIFEYEKVAQVKSNEKELKDYNKEGRPAINGFVNRREQENDTLSLSLVYPNHLMETIKGTVVDTYGNILDINRKKIPLGEGENSITKIKSSLGTQNNKNTYEELKRLERKSIGYHFEMNSRKEAEKSGPPNILNRDNFARDRSRFFLDIDKEGQFKLNVPASSSTGNIALLTRSENYSTIHPNENSKDPNDVAINPDQKDILIEKFLAFDPIQIVDETNSNVGPVDRFSTEKSPQYIGHGTAYHDITKTIRYSTGKSFYNPNEYVATTLLGSGSIEAVPPIVSEKIIVAGPDANAGGRSGSLNFDGSLEMSIGANEVDTQSLWLDTEGGIVANLGEDDKGISIAASLDGDVFLELGDVDVAEGKVFDLKVSNGVGDTTVFRIDKTGMSMTTQGRLVMYSSADMMFRSAARITMDAENIIINGRSHIKDPGKGASR